MLLLVNSTRTMDLSGPVPPRLRGTEPVFAAEAAHLVGRLRALGGGRRIRAMEATSAALADAAQAALARWGGPDRIRRPALFAFTGLLFRALAPEGFSAAVRRRAQQRLVILSGLYGMLRPLDLVEAYRLEMGSDLRPPGAADLAAWWRPRLTAALNGRLRDGEAVLSVAAQEYLRAIDTAALRGPVLTPVFQEERPDGGLRTATVHAKRARGALLRHALATGARRPGDLLGFAEDGWAPATEPPAAGPWLFTRPARG